MNSSLQIYSTQPAKSDSPPMISVFCGVVVVDVGKRMYANVSYCSFVVPGNNSLKVYERVE